MDISARFHSPLPRSRPRGSRLIEAFSPKLGRRLQCFSDRAFDQWICLESDPSILSFCERPVLLGKDADNRVADYWIHRADGEALVVIDDDFSPRPFTVTGDEIPVRTVSSADLAAARIWIGNWERMLPAITACRTSISRSLLNTVLRFISEPMQLSRIERDFGMMDPMLVRAATFTLLHCGQLQAPQLHTQPLSLLTSFEPTEKFE